MRYEYDNEGFLIGECEDADRSTPIAPVGNANNFNGSEWVYVDRAALEAQKAALAAIALEEARKKKVLEQITELEKQVTDRRLREAVLTGDTSFITSIDQQIAALRSTI